jgi:hypothetical protein
MPEVIIRMGSHSEKEYVEKTIHLFDGIMLAANLIEATPGASASLLIRLSGPKADIPFYLDPMTYAFGPYVDSDTQQIRTDLDWIKSEQRVNNKTVRRVKSSYNKLAQRLGPPFSSAVTRGAAVNISDFSSTELVRATCYSVLEYQKNRIRDEFASDPSYSDFADLVPIPRAVFAPYFYIPPGDSKSWIELAFTLIAASAELKDLVPVHAVICADRSFLSQSAFLDKLKSALPAAGVDGVWLWFSRFDEFTATIEELRAFRELVESLAAAKLSVYNMHGGYFSMLLSKVGLSGISQGIGYGEQKDVVPIVGQSTPTVRYYVPVLHRRLGVPEIERCFNSLKITSPASFFKEICDCTICQGIIGKGLQNFNEFGDTHYSTPESKRRAQTPAAAKRCKFHFLLNKRREKEQLEKSSLVQLTADLSTLAGMWSMQPSIRRDADHIGRWKKALM